MEPESTLPDWDSLAIDQLDLSPYRSGAYGELIEHLPPDQEPIHRLFGHPDQIQPAMEQEQSSMLLLQVDSDERPDWMWGDAGRIFFWIPRSDLPVKDFSRVQLVLQCY